MIHYIDDVKSVHLKEFVDRLASPMFFDLETSGLDPRLHKILLAQFMVDDDIYVINVPKTGIKLLTAIAEKIEKENIQVIAFNTKFDWKFIYHHTGVQLTNVFDCMNCEAVLNAGIGKALYSLEELVEKYLGETIDKSVRESFFIGKETSDFTEQQINYSAKDVKVLEEIYNQQIKRIEETGTNRVMEVEMGDIPVVAKMEYDGISVNNESWLKLEKMALRKASKYKPLFKKMVFSDVDLSQYKNAMEVREGFAFPKVKSKKEKAAMESITDPEAIKGWLYDNFNIGSSVQVKQAFINNGINVENTNAKHLKSKFSQYRIVECLLRIREQEKLASTYGSNFLELLHPITGKIHTEFLNNGAATGRMSSNNPNLQNIPRLIAYRNSFIASPGWLIITADYSQAEFRLAGAVSRDAVIIQAYIDGKDMHAATAANVLGKNIHSITRKERNYGKTLNFAILYGTTAWGLKFNLNVDLKEAEKIIRVFYAGYPTFALFKEEAEKIIVERGYSSTPMGRRRYNTEKPLSMNNWQYDSYISRIKREGFNHIIQGGSADTVKLAMWNCYKDNPFGDKFRLLLQEHDELVVEARESIAKDAEVFVVETMKNSFQPFLKDIPAEVDSHLLPYWTK